MQHNELDILLNRRAAAPMAAPDLAERIIHTALSNMPVRQKAQSIWMDLMSMLVIPHPSIAVVTGVLLGLVVGMEASEGLSILQQDWSSFLYINEGGWL